MDNISIVIIAFALAVDTFAVSISSGIAIKRFNIKPALTMASFFGSFQAFMPVAGWFLGITLRNIISGFDHWAAFGLLSFVGVKMIFESGKLESQDKMMNIFNLRVLLLLSLATSIDALAVGISFSLLEISIIKPVIIIGIITFILSVAGVFIGNRIGHFFEGKIERIGGIVLIGIGLKILIEHL